MSYTINPNAKNGWVQNADNTMDLSIETDASSVYLDNGRTLEQEIGEGSMVSNVTTVDSAMSKVIDGTLDGAYESCKMYGKSLVNLMTNCKDEYVVRYHDPSNPNHTVANISMMKPNTEYTLFYKAKHRTEGDGAGTSGVLHIATSIEQGFISTSQGLTTEYKQYVFKFTTSDIVDCFTFKSNGNYFAIKECVLLEGDYTNQDVPFFEGLCDVKMPILRNTGKNLFDISTWKSDRDLQLINNGDGYTITGARGWFVIPVKVGEKYSLTYKGNNSANSDYALELYETNNSNSTPYGEWDLLAVNRFKTPNSVSEISPFTYTAKKKYLIAFHGSSERRLNLYDLQLEESSTATTYEDYKTNILETSNDIVLRGLPNGVKDSYNCLTGEYVRRVRERDYQESDESDSNVITDLVKTHYELAEPIVTQIEPSTTPFAYENGHIILESGHEGQSLLPTLEYSTVINRTGQIQSIANTIQKQEKQITKLEQMLIQNIINLDYNNTLLALKNEMEEML